MRSLVKASGDRRVCFVQHGTAMERKLGLLVKEFTRYRIAIDGIQETKWFESDVWLSGDWTFLHSGWALPVDGDVATWRVGVGILLDGIFWLRIYMWQKL